MKQDTAPTDSDQSGLVINRASDRNYIGAGLRKHLEYADLGVAEATGGKIRVRVARTSGKASPESSGRHFHVLDAQLVFILRGRVRVEFDVLGEVWLEAGDFCYLPPGLVHSESDMSEDYMVLAVNMPADFETVQLDHAS